MIKIQFSGGLGNQMFQYAFAKHLAVKNNTDLVLDLSYIESKLPFKKFSTPMQYELDIFNIDAKLEKLFFGNAVTYPFAKSEFILKTKINTKKLNLLKENNLSFNAEYLNFPDNSFIQGNFQSELYFKEIEKIIRKDFTFNTKLDNENQHILEQIQQTNAVAVHIRRGDYLSIKKNASKFRSLDINYYKNAVNILENKTEQPAYFIFSDNIEWAKNHLNLEAKTTFINHNKGKNSYLDMFLMSQCKHNIIANSTFSWWSAWLNSNHKKLVIAPKIWFLTEEFNQNDIVPKSWITI